MEDKLKIANLMSFGRERGDFFTREPSRSSAKHGGKDKFEELSVLRGYPPGGHSLDENAEFQSYQFFYAPLRRFGFNYMIEILSTEIPVIRDLLCEDLIVRAYKPIGLSHFPE